MPQRRQCISGSNGRPRGDTRPRPPAAGRCDRAWWAAL